MRNLLLVVAVLSLTPAAVTDLPVRFGEPRKLVPVVSSTGEKLYQVHFDNLPCREVMEEIERVTGLMYLSRDPPDVRLTVHFPMPVALEAVFEELTRQLEPHDLVARLNTRSFSVHYAALEWSRGGGYRDETTLDRLPHCPKWWFYRMSLDVNPGGLEQAQRIVDQHFDKWFELQTFGADRLILRGRGRDLQKFVAEMGDRIKR